MKNPSSVRCKGITRDDSGN